MTDDDRATQTRRALFRLEILDAVVAAQERHTEVSAAIAGAADERAAISAIAELLGVTDVSARAISDLPWRRLAIDAQADTRAERDALLRHLNGGTGD